MMMNIQQQQFQYQRFKTRKLRCQTIISEHQDKITYCSTPFLSVSSSSELHFLTLLRLLLFSDGAKGEGGILLGLGKHSLRNDDSDPSTSGDSPTANKCFYF
jgi:hypothetical protein